MHFQSAFSLESMGVARSIAPKLGSYYMHGFLHTKWFRSYLFVAAETPRHNASELIGMYRTKRPQNSPPLKSKEYEDLKFFCKNVEIILLTINDNEFHTAVLFMEKPPGKFEKAVFYPNANMVVGMFANKKTALIQTDVGANCGSYIKEAIYTFPKAQYVIGVGVCYAFSPEQNFGDVLVSKQICDVTNLKFKKNGEIEDRGQTIDVVPELKKLFCFDLVHEYEVSESRSSDVYCGQFISYSALLDNKDMCDKFHAAFPRAIGGEMEGGELMQFAQKRKIKGVIVIKGVVDYADGTKSKEWQVTSAMAAMNYTESKLLRVASLRDECESELYRIFLPHMHAYQG